MLVVAICAAVGAIFLKRETGIEPATLSLEG